MPKMWKYTPIRTYFFFSPPPPLSFSLAFKQADVSGSTLYNRTCFTVTLSPGHDPRPHYPHLTALSQPSS